MSRVTLSNSITATELSFPAAAPDSADVNLRPISTAAISSTATTAARTIRRAGLPLAVVGESAFAKAPQLGKRSAADLESAAIRILEIVSRRPGISSADARSDLGMDRVTWVGAVKRLLADKSIHTDGTRSAMSYYPTKRAPQPEPFKAVPPIKRVRAPSPVMITDDQWLTLPRDEG